MARFFHADRTVKTMLALIAVLLAAIALRPWLPLSVEAQAQREDQSRLFGGRTEKISTIATRDKRGIFPLNGGQSFIVEYKDYIEVYRVQDVVVTRNN